MPKENEPLIEPRYGGNVETTNLDDRLRRVIRLEDNETVVGSSAGGIASFLPPFKNETPTDGYIPIWVNANGRYEAGPLPASGYTFPYHSDGSDSTAINNTTTETEYSTSGFTLPADAFSTIGDFIAFDFSGLLVGIGIGGTLTIRLRANTSNLLATAFSIAAPGGGNSYFHAIGTITATTIGASGEVRTNFGFREYANALVNSSNRTALTVDTTSSIDIGVTAQWSSAVPSNQTRLHQASFVLNKVVT